MIFWFCSGEIHEVLICRCNWPTGQSYDRVLEQSNQLWKGLINFEIEIENLSTSELPSHVALISKNLIISDHSHWSLSNCILQIAAICYNLVPWIIPVWVKFYCVEGSSQVRYHPFIQSSHGTLENNVYKSMKGSYAFAIPAVWMNEK